MSRLELSSWARAAIGTTECARLHRAAVLLPGRVQVVAGDGSSWVANVTTPEGGHVQLRGFSTALRAAEAGLAAAGVAEVPST